MSSIDDEIVRAKMRKLRVSMLLMVSLLIASSFRSGQQAG